MRRGFRAATVIDVGVGDGTPSLYEAFADAHHVLIDPLIEHEPAMKSWLARYEGEYVLKAVGEREGITEMTVVPESLQWSSMLGPPPGRPDANVELRRVEMTTLDSLLEQRGWTGPFGLKIDTEGAEDRVVAGASALLRQTEFVIAEVSVGRSGSYTFAEFIASMDDQGFETLDVLDGLKGRPLGRVTWLDILFRRRRFQ